MNWTYEYDNDTGPGDEGFYEFWPVKYGDCVVFVVKTCEQDAIRLVDFLNAHLFEPENAE